MLWYSHEEGLVKEASEVIYRAVPEQDVSLGPFAYPLNQHHFAQPGDAVLLGKAGPRASSPAPGCRSTLGCCAGAAGSAVYISGTFRAILMEQEA